MPLTDEQKAYVLANHVGVGPKEMALRLGVPGKTVLAFYKNRHLHSGLTGRFERGHVPYSRGKALEDIVRSPGALERIRSSQFGKGHVPHNRTEVGTVSLRRNGTTGESAWFVKVAEPDRWELLNRHEYARLHGPIPDGMMVCFLNGDTNDFRAENLALMSKGENARMNNAMGRDGDPDRTRAMLSLLRLEDGLKEKERNGKEQPADA